MDSTRDELLPNGITNLLMLVSNGDGKDALDIDIGGLVLGRRQYGSHVLATSGLLQDFETVLEGFGQGDAVVDAGELGTGVFDCGDDVVGN